MVALAATGGIGHFGILDMKPGFLEPSDVAGMVILQVGEDDVFEPGGVDAGFAQSLQRIVIERHRSSFPVAPVQSGCPWMICQIFSGVAGMSMFLTP